MLAYKGSLKLSEIRYKTNAENCKLEKCMEFLLNQDLVNQRTINRANPVYSVTKRGVTVLRYFGENKKGIFVLEDLE